MKDNQTPQKYVDDNGTAQWHCGKGGLHNIDGPAIVYLDGRKCWFVNGNRHRLDGPAVIDSMSGP